MTLPSLYEGLTENARRTYERMTLFAFALPLSQRLKRPVEIILSEGLNASDFPGTAVVVVFEDRSIMRFEYAFAVRASGMIGVFTEHCGYHALRERCLISVETDGLAKVVIDG